MNTTYKGKNLMVWYKGKTIALATSHSLDLTINTTDITTKDSNGKWLDSEVTTLQWSLSSDNLCSYGSDGLDTATLLDSALLGEKADVVFGLANPLDAEVPTGGFTVDTAEEARFAYKGSAIITALSVTAANGERATYSVTFTGTGPLTKIQPATAE